TLAFPFVPPGYALPWASFSAFIFERGLGAPNLLHLLAVPAAALIPVAGVAGALAISFERRNRLLWSLAGALAIVALGMLVDAVKPVGFAARLQRAYVADVYFERAGELEKEIARTGTAQPRLLARRERERALPPTNWPY